MTHTAARRVRVTVQLFRILVAATIAIGALAARSARPARADGPAVTVTSAAAPAAVAAGDTATFAATVHSDMDLTGAIVDFEVYDAQDNRVDQTYLSGIHIAAGTSPSFTGAWAVPAGQAAGSYRLRIGVFSGDWSTTYAWDHFGPLFAVGPAASGAGSPIALGVFEPGSPLDGGVALDAYAAEVGHKPAIAMWYEDWRTTGFSRGNFDAVAARGEMPMLSWDPCKDGTVGGAPCSDAAIANGLADDYLRTWARDAAAWGKPFYLRFAWEMNGDWTPYSPGQNGNTAADYIAMWRHVHDIFAQEGATNARWVWCPNSDSPLGVPMATVYPGDAYVDYLGFDAYNWGALDPSWSTWSNARDFFKPPYNTLTSLSSKPIIVCETGSTEVGGDKGAWIRQTFADLPVYFPRIKAVVWFDGGGWGVNTSPGSLAAYRDVVTWPSTQGQLP